MKHFDSTHQAASLCFHAPIGATIGVIQASGAMHSLLLAYSLRFMPRDKLWDAVSKGAGMVIPALAILWFASSMSRMTSNKDAEGRPTEIAYAFKDHRLYTGEYLKEKLVEWN